MARSGDYTRRPTAEPPLHPVQWAFSLPQKVVTISAIHFNRSYRRKPVSSPRWQDSRDATQRHATLKRPCAKVQALDIPYPQVSQTTEEWYRYVVYLAELQLYQAQQLVFPSENDSSSEK